MHLDKEPAQPSAGDLSVCLNCGAMLHFNEILVLKPLPPETLDQLHADNREVLMKASRLIKQRGKFQ